VSGNGDEITAVVREIQQRVRSKYPTGETPFGGVMLPELLPILRARDAAEGKIAAIGTVNPRPPGFVNNIAQFLKRQVARALNWHVREQVEFNRAIVGCVEAVLAALNDYNRALNDLSARTGGVFEELRASLRRAEDEATQMKDVRSHWAEWRKQWENRLAINEAQFLRSVADLQAAFQQRTSQMESNFRETVVIQHRDFQAALDRSALDVQGRLWADLERVRTEYERLIHNELRVLRQRTQMAAPASGALRTTDESHMPTQQYDALRFADRFRGTVEYVRENQRFYVPFFKDRKNVLDIGCGRGEFLFVMQEAGVAARGIDVDRECVDICRAAGLEAEVADLFSHLNALPAGSLDGIFCGQVVEHLAPERLPEFLRLAANALDRDGMLVIETPNPECLAIFATHFYLDPTHTRPIPPPLLVFYMEEFGFGRIEVHRRFPAIDSMPSLAALPQEIRDTFFGALDYGIAGRKL
jgi:O-antigen chain-terminating methyltransferase